MRTRSLAAIASLAASLMAAPAIAATTYTWDTNGNSGPNSQLTFSSAENPNEQIKVRAYQISSLSAGSNTFQTASLYQYSGGLGITSTGENGTSPNHAIDNSTSSGRYEFLLVEFDSNKYTNMGFQIGWSQNDSDVQVWVGDAAAGLNLASGNACNGGACDFTELGLLGFNNTQTFTDVPLDTTKTVSGQITGRYLLIAGRLAGGDSNKDYFKISFLTGTESTSVPEPSSLMLLGAAIAGAGFAGRKRRAA